MKILLLFNKRTREGLTANLIEESISKKDSGAIVRTIFWDEEDNNLVEIVSYAPDTILTFPLTIPDLIEEISAIKTICQSRIYVLITEGFLAESELKKAVGRYKYPSNLIDGYLFYGGKFCDIYMECLRDNNRCQDDTLYKVVGYSQWEWENIYKNTNFKNEIEYVKSESGRYEKSVLVLSGFAEADKTKKQILVCNDSYDAFSKDKNKQIEEVLENVEKFKNYREKYYSILKLLAERNPNIKFYLKLHPVEITSYKNKEGYDFTELSKVPNIEIITHSFPTCIYLRHVDFLIHYGSTASVEAYAMNIPSIAIPSDFTDIFPSDLISDSIEDMERFILSNKPCTYTKERDQFCKDYFDFEKEKEYCPSDKIADILLKSVGYQQKFENYVDYGFYNRLKKAYMLMAIKRYILLRYSDGKKLIDNIILINKFKRSRRKDKNGQI